MVRSSAHDGSISGKTIALDLTTFVHAQLHKRTDHSILLNKGRLLPFIALENGICLTCHFPVLAKIRTRDLGRKSGFVGPVRAGGSNGLISRFMVGLERRSLLRNRTVRRLLRSTVAMLAAPCSFLKIICLPVAEFASGVDSLGRFRIAHSTRMTRLPGISGPAFRRRSGK